MSIARNVYERDLLEAWKKVIEAAKFYAIQYTLHKQKYGQS